MRTQTRRGYAVEFKQLSTEPMWEIMREVADWLETRPDLEKGSIDKHPHRHLLR